MWQVDTILAEDKRPPIAPMEQLGPMETVFLVEDKRGV
jgi:hypothetical protein